MGREGKKERQGERWRESEVWRTARGVASQPASPASPSPARQPATARRVKKLVVLMQVGGVRTYLSPGRASPSAATVATVGLER